MHTVPHRLPTDSIEINRIQGLRLSELRIVANLLQTALARRADMKTEKLGAPFSDLWHSRH